MYNDLCDPNKDRARKYRVIEKIFPKDIKEFLKLLIEMEDLDEFREIAKALRSLEITDINEKNAILTYVTPPTEEQLTKIREFLNEKMGEKDYKLIMREDRSIGGGFILRAGITEYDWSVKGRVNQFAEKIKGKINEDSYKTGNIINILKAEVEEFELYAKGNEIGYVCWVGDGIARITGLAHVVYGEIVIFDNGAKGMVLDLKKSTVGGILFDRENEIREGTRVVRTGNRAGMRVGNNFLGRVIDALGVPIDGIGPIESTESRPIETIAPGIVERKSVSVPMETGILAIDSMFPIGRGQRELIIGDRQTGKTSIAIDTIINQKGKDVICIYVAIGQKASTVAKLVATLKKNEAMDYTTVVSSTASDPSPLQYIAPYSATALAEYYMYQGKDVLIVYDDLSKHAVAYRAISLLLERPPGREAYPGDVFYLHSRLLERSCRLAPEYGGGSITALPIIETQAGDVSAYIPTNVISITDGQIYLESNLFFAGQRPAVNVGLSVSRVGGAAQTPAMKKTAGSLRIDLSQYREMEVFTQFSSDLDQATKDQLNKGKALMEILKQPLEHPLSMAEQVILLFAANKKFLTDIPTEEIRDFTKGMLKYLHENYEPDILTLTNTKMMNDPLADKLYEGIMKYKEELWTETEEKPEEK
ncbi:MAG: F0F1 ATP synthase subunit alpha [Lachnospiraceae bacterium]|nr:F0F1 ATP synthase subunit alpha [Lachnospiraceae bacterium]